MPKKLTNEEFLYNMKMKKPTITPLETYINASTPIKFQCNECGHIFINAPIRILGTRNQGCAKCYVTRRTMTNIEFNERAKANKNVIVIGSYNGIKNKVKVKCTYCGKEFDMRADNILEGRGHGSCIQKNIERAPLITQEEFLQQCNKNNKDILPLGTYTKQADKMLFRCKKCGHEWEARTGHIMLGESGCPRCNRSKGELKIENYLEKNNIDFKAQYPFQDCKDQNCLPFDFYIPSKNICIEYDGEQHFREVEYFNNTLKYIQKHDRIKTDYCKSNNINLIRIPYTEFNNIESILNEFIK